MYLIRQFPRWDRRTPGKKSALLFTPEMLMPGYLERCYKKRSFLVLCPALASPGRLVSPGSRTGPDSHGSPITDAFSGVLACLRPAVPSLSGPERVTGWTCQKQTSRGSSRTGLRRRQEAGSQVTLCLPVLSISSGL